MLGIKKMFGSQNVGATFWAANILGGNIFLGPTFYVGQNLLRVKKYGGVKQIGSQQICESTYFGGQQFWGSTFFGVNNFRGVKKCWVSDRKEKRNNCSG